ncbi:MAG: hypothetical protein A3B16_02900 [Candidatus Zambryskibacteria bacterium RIFCSPLOWO2_01_FULL_45_43]|uniref:Uncharacterized protein n=1 Tax=Candidatus Zambryskibacteria bacterium RIFCSPLOWO2_01_FULL_45_43 TaxID=1802762 RepID=A0A1G2U9R1_9BACT|nr:MAG: hypothetical protein A3B16_02900 [Candidatus Zambryskibacteria bacterium RIFCSPLOWO2_01_FULL_45_43]
MEFYQIILLVFFGTSQLIGFFIYLLNMPDGDGVPEKFIGFVIWCIYVVLSLGIYFYLGTINYY